MSDLLRELQNEIPQNMLLGDYVHEAIADTRKRRDEFMIDCYRVQPSEAKTVQRAFYSTTGPFDGGSLAH